MENKKINYSKENVEKICELLERYVSENEESVKELRIKRKLYSELISILNNPLYIEQPIYLDDDEVGIYITLLLKRIYGDTENPYLEIFNCILSDMYIKDEESIRRNLKKFRSLISEDMKNNNDTLEKKDKQLKRNHNLLETAKRSISRLKKGFLLSKEYKYEVDNIKEILAYFKVARVISSDEYQSLIETIELYDEMVLAKKYTGSIHTIDDIRPSIPNISKTGMKYNCELDFHYNRRKILDSFVDGLKFSSGTISPEELIKEVKKFEEIIPDINELNYIITNLLNKLFDDLTTLYELLMEEQHISETYFESLKEYTLMFKQYNNLERYYMELNRPGEQLVPVNETDSTEIAKPTGSKRKLIYLIKLNVDDEAELHKKAMIFQDIKQKKITPENFGRIQKLLIGFKEGTITAEGCTRSKGNFVLKDDQIRIILSHVRNNIYCVKGVSLIKANNDKDAYGTVTSRIVPQINDDIEMSQQLKLAEWVEDELEKLVIERGRKSNR